MNDGLFKESCLQDKIIKKSYYKNVFVSLLTNLKFIIPLCALLLIFITGFIFSKTVNYEILDKVDFNNALISPNKNYIFGTNQYGQNMFYLILIGTYNTLKLAFITTVIYVTIGVIIGILWGNNSKLNAVMLFFKSIFDSIPKLFLFSIVIFALGKNSFALLISIILFNWINIACLVRNNLILVKNKDYNLVSKLNKASFFKISINNYLPSILPVVFNSIAISIPELIAFEVTISCFGFTIIKNNISLGNIMYTSIYKNIYFSYPYLFFIPLIFLFIINLCFYFISQTISKTLIKKGE